MRLPWYTLAALSVAVGCSEQAASPTSPLSPTTAAVASPASFAGAWQIAYRNDECLSRHCFSSLGQESRLDLRLTQIGDRVTGVIAGPTGYTDVTGTVTPDGRVSLGGRSTPGSYGAPGLVVDRLEFERDTASGLRGYVRLFSEYDGETSAYNGGAGGAIVRARHAALSDTFAGTWQGYYDTTDCLPGPACLTERRGELELTIADHAGGLTGTLSIRLRPPAAVSGAHDGRSARLAGAGLDYQVETLHVQRDATGRLSGTATLRSGGVVMTIALVRVGRLSDEL